MTEHLTECLALLNDSTWDGDCICDALRACEQRVFQEQIEGRQHDMVMAYLRGLDAAEQAVAEALKERMVMADCSPNTMRACLLAIQALKEKP